MKMNIWKPEAFIKKYKTIDYLIKAFLMAWLVFTLVINNMFDSTLLFVFCIVPLVLMVTVVHSEYHLNYLFHSLSSDKKRKLEKWVNQ